jgi:hypothetical protein
MHSIKQEYLKNPKKCQECGKEIPYGAKRKRKVWFCGNSCSAVYRGRNHKLSEVGLKKLSEKSKIAQKRIWTKEKRLEHSIKMKSIVDLNPTVYSSKNVCGRVKTINTIDSFGNKTTCLGRWEFLVIEYLNSNNIRWINKIDENFQYFWNGSYHRYFPDFKLIDYKDTFIEVKGYERDRDRAKWKSFPHKLIILKEKEIEEIKTKTYKLRL